MEPATRSACILRPAGSEGGPQCTSRSQRVHDVCVSCWHAGSRLHGSAPHEPSREETVYGTASHAQKRVLVG